MIEQPASLYDDGGASGVGGEVTVDDDRDRLIPAPLDKVAKLVGAPFSIHVTTASARELFTYCRFGAPRECHLQGRAPDKG